MDIVMKPSVADQYCGLLSHLEERLFSDDFKDRHRCKAKYFTRQRCLSFPVLIFFDQYA